MTAERNLEAYEANLEVRQRQLQTGQDKAYEQIAWSITEAILLAQENSPDKGSCRIIDVGCGLGYVSSEIRRIPGSEVVGIDPIQKAVEQARLNHPDLKFYQSRAQDFLRTMLTNGEPHFDHSVLNMVLHSVPDEEVVDILAGLKPCLRPYGSINIVVPTQKWLQTKLIEVAKGQNMTQEMGVPWVHQQLKKTQVEIPISTTDGEHWPYPVTVYNRTLDDYANMLYETGYGISYEYIDEEAGTSETIWQPFWIPDDNMFNYEMSKRERVLLMSLSLPMDE